MYEITDGHTVKHGKDGVVDLANFSAKILKEIYYVDADKKTTYFQIAGRDSHDKPLPEIQVPATNFPSMSWVLPAWGSRAVIMPIPSAERELKTAIMVLSKPQQETIYTHTGWIEANGKHAYLDAHGAITPKGRNSKYRVHLPPELSRFRLRPDPAQLKPALKATLQLVNLAPPPIAWPLLAAIFRPIFTTTDYAVHLTGKTGTFKSELASLVQSHWGSDFDARHLPGSWSSTGNALEAQAYRTKDAIFVIDDFVPFGTSWQVRALQKTVDQLVRGQGNQAGRARLTDISSFQTTMYPRGLIFSTGEDTPVGHSVRARMLILELSPGDIAPEALTKAQAARKLFSVAMGNFVQHIASDLPGHVQRHARRRLKYRDDFHGVGHSRTPSMLGDIMATLSIVLDYANELGVISDHSLPAVRAKSANAVMEIGQQQYAYLHEADITENFIDGIRTILATKAGHFRTVNGGIPSSPDLLGWSEVTSEGDLPTYRHHGKPLGWVDWNTDAMYLDATVGWPEVKRFAKITLTKQTMFKRLKDASLLTRVDDGRKRNTIRVTCQGHTRQVLALSMAYVLQTQEAPSE